MRANGVSGVYCIFNVVNGRRYVGSSKHIKNRWTGHKNDLRRGRHGNEHLQKAWNKYGESSFVFYVLEYCCVSLLDHAECRAMKQLRTHDRNVGYNILGGGATSRSMSEEVRRKMSDARKGVCPPASTLAAMHAAVRGKKQSPEHVSRRISSARASGKIHRSPEAIARHAAKLRGRKVSAEIRQRISDGQRLLSYSDVRDACRLKVNGLSNAAIASMAHICLSTCDKMLVGKKGYVLCPQIMREECDYKLAMSLNRIRGESARTTRESAA